MLESIAYIFIFGIVFAKIFSFLKIPDIVGMIFAGIFLNYFDLIDIKVENISADLRQIALVIILTRAGLSLNLDNLKKSGKSVVLMSFLPAICEILAVSLFAPLIFGISFHSAAILGCVVSAVSPAIIVPRMISLKNKGYSQKIPDLILAGASVDDIFVITLFYCFINLSTENLFLIPINILLGVVFGIISAYILQFFFKKLDINYSVIIFLATSFVLLELENFISFSALLSIMVVGIVINYKNEILSHKLSQKFSSLWSGFMIILFVLVGISLNLDYALSEGVKPVILILICLTFRAIGTYFCVIGSNFTQKERIFCVISYLPKATVQAGIGFIPLSLGLENGDLILSVSVVAILITAPLGAFLIDNFHQKLLQK